MGTSAAVPVRRPNDAPVLALEDWRTSPAPLSTAPTPTSGGSVLSGRPPARVPPPAGVGVSFHRRSGGPSMSSSEKWDLLSEVVRKHRDDLLPRLASISERPLSIEEREQLRHAIADELLDSGLDESHEHNARGKLLED